MKRPPSFRILIFSLVLGLLSPPAQSGEAEAPVLWPVEPVPEPVRWQYTLAPYAFLAGIDGQVEIDGNFADFGLSFSDLLENIDGGFILAGQARRGRFSLLGDFIYLGVSGDGSTADPVYDRANIELDSVIFTGLASYRTWDGPHGYLELGGGFRFYYSDTELLLRDSSGVNENQVSTSEIEVWDAIAAVRFGYQLSPRWSLRFYGDVGAGESDLTWQASANLACALNSNTALFMGYRYLAYDLESEGSNLDLSFSGPQIGVGFRF